MTAPHRTRIKFCGMTRADDITAAAGLGVDAIGLILVPTSKRHVTLTQALALRTHVPPFVASIALLLDADPAETQRIATTLRPTYMQFHGNESPQDCQRAGLPYLKAVPMAEPDHAVAYAERYPHAAAFLLDSHAAGGQGGSGHAFDWSTIPALPRPVILAGGLTPDNVFDAVVQVRPYAVDVSSGIEAAPGRKDADAMRRFVAEVRRADAFLATSRI